MRRALQRWNKLEHDVPYRAWQMQLGAREVFRTATKIKDTGLGVDFAIRSPPPCGLKARPTKLHHCQRSHGDATRRSAPPSDPPILHDGVGGYFVSIARVYTCFIGTLRCPILSPVHSYYPTNVKHHVAGFFALDAGWHRSASDLCSGCPGTVGLCFIPRYRISAVCIHCANTQWWKRRKHHLDMERHNR